MKCNCIMKWYKKSSVQSLDSQLDSQQSASVNVESAPTHRPQLDFQLNSQQLTLVRRVRRSRTSTTPHTPNLILNLIATGNFSDGTRHTRPTPNLIANLIATGNFSGGRRDRAPPISIRQKNLYKLTNKKLYYRTTNITFASV